MIVDGPSDITKRLTQKGVSYVERQRTQRSQKAQATKDCGLVMATTKNKNRVFDETELADIEQQLRDMVSNKSYNTDSSYSANLADYPSHLIPFVDKHMNYIVKHSNIDPEHYIANLRLITKIRT